MVLADPVDRHQCIIYDGSPSRTLVVVAAAIRRNLAAGIRCRYLNSPTMVAGARSQLYAVGTDVQYELSRGALILDSDTSHLIDGRFDVDRMIDMLETAVDAALADGFAGLFATGDMSWEFGPEKDFSKLVEYEWRLEQVFRKQPALSGICQYHRDLLPREAVRDGAVSHARLFVNDTLTQLNPNYVAASSPTARRLASQPELDDAIDALVRKADPSLPHVED